MPIFWWTIRAWTWWIEWTKRTSISLDSIWRTIAAACLVNLKRSLKVLRVKPYLHAITCCIYFSELLSGWKSEILIIRSHFWNGRRSSRFENSFIYLILIFLKLVTSCLKFHLSTLKFCPRGQTSRKENVEQNCYVQENKHFEVVFR